MNARKILTIAVLVLLISPRLAAQVVAETPKAHSPKRATAYSAILPGLGQVYNHQAWKIPIIYALGATTTYVAVYNYQNSQKFKTEYYNRIEGRSDELLADYANYSDESILSLHQAYDKNFQLGIMLTAAVYLLNIVDAMVYGHLFDFNINDDLAGRIVPFAAPNLQTLSPNIGMPLSKRIK